MIRPFATAFVLLSIGLGCTADRLAGAPPAATVGIPDELQLEWRGFDVRLDPTVVLWARDAEVDITRLVRRSLARIQGELRGSPVRIKVQAGSYRTIPDVGIGGFTDPSSGDVNVVMDQRSPVGLRRLLTVWMPMALAHELHHSKRILDGPGYGTTLLDAMVTEGSAEAFVRSTYPDAPEIPWVQPFRPKQEADVWERARHELDELDEDTRHETWFFGRDGLPRWAGYRIGYAITRAYLTRHRDRTAADLATVSSREVLAGSKYEPRTTESQ